MKLLLSLFLLITISTHVVCQINQPNRFEKEWEYTNEDFKVIPAKEDGLVLVRGTGSFKKGNQFWEVTLLDTTLRETLALEIEIDVDSRLVAYEHAPGFVYILFDHKSKNEMDLLAINLKSKEIIRHKIKPELNFKPTRFCKTGNNFVLSGLFNTKLIVLHYTPATERVIALPGFFEDNRGLIDLHTNENQTFNVLLIDKGDKNRIIFRTFDDSGLLLLESTADIEGAVEVQNGVSSALKRDDLMIAGTWGKINSEKALGLYTMMIDPVNSANVNRIYFGQLDNYLSYLKPRKAAKIKSKTLSALEEKKTPNFSDFVMAYEIAEYEKGFLLFVESYVRMNKAQPKVNKRSKGPNELYPDPSRGNYIRNAPGGPSVPKKESFKTLQSAVIAYDAKGERIWDHNVKLESDKKPFLERSADFQLRNNVVHFLYKKEAMLKLHSIDLSNSKTTDIPEKIKLTDMNDEVVIERPTSQLKQWYDNNFYVWGFQSIKNNKTTSVKEVFYINKIVVR